MKGTSLLLSVLQASYYAQEIRRLLFDSKFICHQTLYLIRFALFVKIVKLQCNVINGVPTSDEDENHTAHPTVLNSAIFVMAIDCLCGQFFSITLLSILESCERR